MTRILITTTPVTGHVRPALPLAAQLVAAGHDVTWYTGAKFAHAVSATGADYRPIREALDYDDADLPGARRTPRWRDQAPAVGRPQHLPAPGARLGGRDRASWSTRCAPTSCSRTRPSWPGPSPPSDAVSRASSSRPPR